MKITIESTSRVVTLKVDGHAVPARVWQGETDAGVPVQCYVTRIAPEVEASDPRRPELLAAFERDLESVAAPRASVEAIPLRLII